MRVDRQRRRTDWRVGIMRLDARQLVAVDEPSTVPPITL